VTLNPSTFFSDTGSGSKRLRSESPLTSFLTLPEAPLGHITIPPTQLNVPPKRIAKRARLTAPTNSAGATLVDNYTEGFLMTKAPLCNYLCIEARRGIRHRMLTVHPYPGSSTEALTLSKAAYAEAQTQNSAIHAETSAS
jgi:hypothetical protein